MNKIRARLNSIYFHQIWFALVFLIFIVGGGLIFIRNIYRKFTLIREMDVVTKKLSSREDKLNLLANDLRSLEPYMPAFNDLVSKFEVHEYMIDLVIKCAEAGYTLDKFNPGRSTQENLKLSVQVSGYRDPAYLIESIESMERITNINNVDISFSQRQTVVKLNMEVLSGN